MPCAPPGADQTLWQVIVPMIFLLVALVAVTYGIHDSADAVQLSMENYASPSYIPYSYDGTAAMPKPGAGVYVSIAGNHSYPDTFACSDFTQGKLTEKMAYARSAAALQVVDVFGVDQYTDNGEILKTWNDTGTTPAFLDLSCDRDNVEKMSNYLMGTIEDQKTSRYGALVYSDSVFSSDKQATKSFLVFHNGSAYHAMPTFLKLANEQILQSSTNNPNAYIRVSIDPLSMTNKETASNDTIKGLVLCFFLIIAFSIIPSTFVYSLVSEVNSKSKHQQMISGVNPAAYWFAAFAWDSLNYLVPAACSIALLYAFDVKAYIGENIGATVAVFILYGCASISLTYVLSFGFKDQNNALLACIAIYAVSGFILFFASWIMSLFDSTKDVDDKLRYIYMLSPQYAFAMALYEIFYNDASKFYPSAFDTEVSGKMMIYLGASTFVYMWFTLLLQRSSTSQTGCLSRFFHRSPEVPEDPPFETDEDVINEADLLDNNPPPPENTPIIVKHLRKVYYGRGNVSAKVAVRDLSFHVPEGQVFGFLGINGAGKTTSLSMLSGEFPPTSGEGYLNGLEMCANREEINRSMGYCPQFDALFGKLTGREHLQLYARIKGISHQDEDTVVASMIEMMDLSDHADREAGGYSGGNKRKLSVAISLMGSPRIVFLDEPSTGMDPEARRFMWNVISNTMCGRSVILTTHSMEEAEALSHNVGIMVGGRLRCLGTTQHLKDKYGKGYSLELRTSDQRANELKKWVQLNFKGATLEEEIGGQLRFEVPQANIALSSAFKKLDEDKAELGLDDFSVSQTTLEQVFVKFAQQQEEETGMSAADIAAGMKESLPNFADMCLCKPKTHYEWFVQPKDKSPGNLGTRVAIDYRKAACLCCNKNPGKVTISDFDPSSEIDPVTGSYPYSNEREIYDIVLDETSAPGCPDAPCVGCRNGCCGATQGSCCMATSHVFYEKGHTFEIVPYNEIPMTHRAHPCFLMVDGKEADTGTDRNPYLEEVFWSASKKWCCTIALPLFLVMIAVYAIKQPAVNGLVSILFWSVIIWCVCGNYCRSKHFQRTPEVVPYVDLEGQAFVTTEVVRPSAERDYNPLFQK